MTAPPERFIDVDGLLNFRDLGGLPTVDGATTRAGVMFRSDALHHLTSAGVEHLVGLGIRTIIDLRSLAELERSGRGPLEHTDVRFVHAPLTHTDGSGVRVLPPGWASGDVGRTYVESLPGRSAMLATVIGHLADPGGLPAVFHCTAGKDRTGMVAALVLSLVGVPDDAIVHDYTLTDDRMVLVLERLRGANLVPGDAPLVLEKVARAEAESMETFLHAVRDEFGDAEGWARSVGLGDEQLHSLREVLVGHAR